MLPPGAVLVRTDAAEVADMPHSIPDAGVILCRSSHSPALGRGSTGGRAGRSGGVAALQPLAPVRRPEVELRSLGDDPRRVDLRMRRVVVALDVVEVDRVGDARLLVEVAQVAGQVCVVVDAPQVALEVADVDGV